MQEQTIEITYENALIYLRPSSIIESFAVKLKDAKEVSSDAKK